MFLPISAVLHIESPCWSDQYAGSKLLQSWFYLVLDGSKSCLSRGLTCAMMMFWRAQLSIAYRQCLTKLLTELITSAFFSAETSVRSPQEIFIFIFLKKNSGSKYPKKNLKKEALLIRSANCKMTSQILVAQHERNATLFPVNQLSVSAIVRSSILITGHE